MFKKFPFLCCFSIIGAMLFSISLPVNAQQEFEDLPLNGLAIYQQLRKDYFVGGLYLQSITQDAESSFSFTGKKRMDMRILTDKWSPRRFAQQWNQAILINNDQESLNQFADQILAFIELPKENLITGDHITVDLDPDIGTTVYLNGQVVIDKADSQFFDILLNTWIGQRPPSSEFKNDILTFPADQAGTDLLIQYEGLSYSNSRSNEVAAWIKNNEGSSDDESVDDNAVAAPPGSGTTVVAKRNTASTNDSTDTQPESQNGSNNNSADIEAPTLEVEQPTLAVKIPVTAIATSTTAATTTTTAAAETTLPAPTPSTTTAQIPVSGAVDTPSELDNSEPYQALNIASAALESIPKQDNAGGDSSDQESILAQYRSDILKLTYLNTQYPKRAIEFKQQGIVVLSVKLDRSGELIDIAETTSTKYKMLNKAARKAVRKTAPYPDIPVAWVGDVIEVSLPFNFKY